MMDRFIFFLFYFFFICCSLPSHAQEESPFLTLEECIERAKEQNPEQIAARLGISIAHSSSQIAKAPYYPDIDLTAGYQRFQQRFFFPNGLVLPNNVPPIVGPTNDWNIHLLGSYLLYDSGVRRARYLQALTQEELASEESHRLEQQIILQVILSFYQLAARKELLEVATLQVQRWEEHHSLVEKRRKAGSAPLSDLFKVQVDLSQAKQNEIRADQGVQLSQGELNVAMGVDPETPLTIHVDTVRIEPPPDDLGLAMQKALLQRAEIQSSYQKIAALEQELHVAKGAAGPKLAAFGTYGRQDVHFFPQDHEWSFGVNFSLPLFKGYAIVNRIRQVEQQLCQEKAFLEKTILAVKQNVWEARSQMQEAFQMIHTTQVQLADAQENLRLTKARYEVEVGTLTDFLDAQAALSNAEALFISAKWSYLAAISFYNWAQGSL